MKAQQLSCVLFTLQIFQLTVLIKTENLLLLNYLFIYRAKTKKNKTFLLFMVLNALTDPA